MAAEWPACNVFLANQGVCSIAIPSSGGFLRGEGARRADERRSCWSIQVGASQQRHPSPCFAARSCPSPRKRGEGGLRQHACCPFSPRFLRGEGARRADEGLHLALDQLAKKQKAPAAPFPSPLTLLRTPASRSALGDARTNGPQAATLHPRKRGEGNGRLIALRVIRSSSSARSSSPSADLRNADATRSRPRRPGPFRSAWPFPCPVPGAASRDHGNGC